MKNQIYIEEPNKVFYKTNTKGNANDNTWRKCNNCGKFISYKQMKEQKDVMLHFIPDTEFTIEEAYWVHTHCSQFN